MFPTFWSRTACTLTLIHPCQHPSPISFRALRGILIENIKLNFYKQKYSRFISTGVLLNVNNSKSEHKSSLSSSSNTVVTSLTSETPKLWDLYASICLERKPIITKELTPMEEKYSKFFEEIEFESSKLSNHEVRHTKDLKLIEKIKRGETDKGNIQTAQDYEDVSTKELMKFVPLKHGRVTEADKKKNTKSLQRALDSHLLLVVEQRLGNDYRWICPQLKRIEGETLRQTAERILHDTCPDVKATILGNAPWGFYKYSYPKGVQNEKGETVTGAKVFFYKAKHISGNLESGKGEVIEVKDFQWLMRSELKEKLKEEYHHTLSQFLIDEN